MEKKRLSEMARMNRFALIGWSVVVTVIELAYLLEVIKGERSIAYYVAMLLMGSLPVAFGWSMFNKNRDNRKIRYMVAYFYSVLYGFVLLTGDTVLTFIYIFPIMAVLLVYSDTKLLRDYAFYNVLFNIISVVVRILVYKETTPNDIADYEIQVIGTLVVLFISYYTCRLMGQMNDDKMKLIASQSAKQEEVLQHIMNATQILNERVAHIDSQAKDIQKQSESAQVSIEEIASGTADVANNIQEQLGMSTGISQELENLTSVSKEIQEKFAQTHQMSQAGIQNVNTLSKSAEMVANSKEEVSAATESLTACLQEAKEILSLIRSITDQTNLLALNASIEAARAGEQGKGFAVVAGEIQKLSGDTGNATDKISDILETLAAEASKVITAVENLDEVSNRQNELIQTTDEQFRVIDANISDMTDGVKKQGDFLTNINDNNNKIAGSIASTSAYTQQLTASSENTMNMTKESLEGTKNMAEYLTEILGQVQNLQAITEE